jgi:hypothetical protein
MKLMSVFGLRALVFFAVAALVLSSACSDDESAGAPKCSVGLAEKCQRDDQCCDNRKCMWQGDGAYCQERVAPDPPCSKGNEGCTQDSHCCSKKCIDGSKCEKSPNEGSSGGSTSACLPLNAECVVATACCSRVCKEDPNVKKSYCSDDPPTPDPNPGGGCKGLNEPCTLPANCCSNQCLVGRCTNG